MKSVLANLAPGLCVLGGLFGVAAASFEWVGWNAAGVALISVCMMVIGLMLWGFVQWSRGNEQAKSLSHAQSLALMGSFIYDFTSDRWSRSAALHAILDLGPDAPASGSGWKEFLAKLPRSRADFLAKVASMPGDAQAYEVRLRSASGDNQWVQVSTEMRRDEDGHALEIMAIIQDITQRKKDEREILRLGYFDSLTGLPNKVRAIEHLSDLLAQSRDAGGIAAVLFVNIDGFKRINDARGHGAGDAVLKQVAERIASSVGESDLVARFGGDEFIVVLDLIAGRRSQVGEAVFALGNDLRKLLGQAYVADGLEHHCTASVGLVLMSDGRCAAEDLIKQAGMAMHKVKADGGNAVMFFEDSIQEALQDRAEIERDLRRDLRAGALSLHYQVQANRDGTPTGAEVLLRWNRGGHESVSPGKFIPIAEEGALIVEIGNWVLESACMQLKCWSQQKGFGHLTLAVNVSPRQFSESDFVRFVEAMLTKHGIRPELLKLELTEGLMVKNVEDVIEKMHQLHALGVNLSLDDFGTGYSSLWSLKNLPVDQLKIDQSFVRDVCLNEADTLMVQTIIDMANNFGLSVIAEGVETHEQLQFLIASGCGAFQGYYFGKPLPLEDFERELSRINLKEAYIAA